MIQKICTINRLADPVCIDVCTRPRKSLKDYVEYPHKWHPNRFVSRGWLRNSSSRGVAAAATLAIICIHNKYTHITSRTHRHHIQSWPFSSSVVFGFFLSYSQWLKCVISCTQLHRVLKIFRGFFFVQFQNTKPSPIRNRPIVSNSSEWIG